MVKSNNISGWIIRCFLTVAVGVFTLLTGCANTRPRQEVDWDAFMTQLRVERAEKAGVDVNAPDAPVDALPPPPSEDVSVAVKAGEVTIQPDSVLQVTVREDSGLDGSYQVNEISAIQLGYVGPVFLHNMTEAQAADKIKEVLETRFFNQATVSVRILRASYDKVAVQGRVAVSGIIKIGSGDRISLNDALLRVGNVTASIKSARVRVVRGGLLRAVSASEPGEVYSLVDEAGNPDVPEVYLWNNDIAFVYASSGTGDTPAVVAEKADKDVLVLGEVKRQGLYQFADGAPATMMHLIFKMGGFPAYANTKAIKIIRRDAEGRENEIIADASQILQDGNPDRDITLEHGDRVIVPARRMSLF
jgi:protein involved in polysaccharide export with SLBB domain